MDGLEIGDEDMELLLICEYRGSRNIDPGYLIS
jgi:hypothetical protein